MRVWVALMVATVALAGCTDPGEPAGPNVATPGATFELQAGRGAIAGLLVDDRFRPIHLDAGGVEGFVLLQETGQQTMTNQNGEFTFADLQPGTYTLRVTAMGHEAVPQKLQVEVGLFSEVSLVARRIADLGGAILTTEYSIFSFCSANVLLPLSDACTVLDLSGDSGRIQFTADYTSLNGTMTALVTEFEANQDGDFFIMMGHDLADLGNVEYFLTEYINGDTTRCVNIVGELAEPCLDTGLGNAFHVASPLDYVLYINGMYDDEINEVLFGLPLTGVGASLAVKGRFMLSAFLGEPEVDLDSYCILC